MDRTTAKYGRENNRRPDEREVMRMCNSLCRALMCTNVGASHLRTTGDLLVIGSCIPDRHPDILKRLQTDDPTRPVLHVCLEETHMNQAGYKLASIIRYSGIKSVTALTVDGSPHCVQLHYLLEDIKRHFVPELMTSHYVIEKGELFRVTAEAVKRSRHLSKVCAQEQTPRNRDREEEPERRQ